jgi:hypothetical protein
MGFIANIQEKITGKTAQQRASDKLAADIQRREIQKAAMEERGRQSVRIATEREKIIADARLRKIKEGYNRPASSIGGGNMLGGFFTQAAAQPSISRMAPKRKVYYVKRGKRYVRKVSKGGSRMIAPVAQARYDPIGGFGFGGGKYKVI